MLLSQYPVTNPLHDRSGPGTFWTTVNAAEALPGVSTVINSRIGTQVLRTGDLLRVDGDAGRVEVLRSAP